MSAFSVSTQDFSVMYYRIFLLILTILLAKFAWASDRSHTSPRAWASTELHPNDARWYTQPWPEQAIRYRLTQIPVTPEMSAAASPESALISLHPEQQYQTLLGLGSSLEHASVYAIRKNKTPVQQREILNALIDPKAGIGMNLFRISIGTSDFSDGTWASTPPDNTQGWYSFQDTADSPFSIQRNIELGIVDVLKMAVEVGKETANPVRFVASPWSPPRWMREHNNMVQGGTLKPEYYAAYAQYLRQFIQAYAKQGIPIYAITLQNERQFEPPAYPGMVLSWQQERDLLIKVYENFHNIGGEYGEPLAVKLWGLDHNFNYWQQAVAQLDSLSSLGKLDYLDGTAFHHYAGDSSAMQKVHAAYPNKDVVFTEGSLWGVGKDNPNRGFQAVIRHLRHWSTAYLSWATMLPQQLDEANQSPYNKLGVVGPTMLIQEKGQSRQWYKLPEYWLMGQFSRFLQPGAKRINSQPVTFADIENVAFQNPDGSIACVLSNPAEETKAVALALGEKRWQVTLPAHSIVTVVW